jgi:hypothetical protein
MKFRNYCVSVVVVCGFFVLCCIVFTRAYPKSTGENIIACVNVKLNNNANNISPPELLTDLIESEFKISVLYFIKTQVKSRMSESFGLSPPKKSSLVFKKYKIFTEGSGYVTWENGKTEKVNYLSFVTNTINGESYEIKIWYLLP